MEARPAEDVHRLMMMMINTINRITSQTKYTKKFNRKIIHIIFSGRQTKEVRSYRNTYLWTGLLCWKHIFFITDNTHNWLVSELDWLCRILALLDIRPFLYFLIQTLQLRNLGIKSWKTVTKSPLLCGLSLNSRLSIDLKLRLVDCYVVKSTTIPNKRKSKS